MSEDSDGKALDTDNRRAQLSGAALEKLDDLQRHAKGFMAAMASFVILMKAIAARPEETPEPSREKKSGTPRA